ncbi:MAG: 16S rRNA (uracil(1498)-N(3))-methyltransferase [Jatrophihabitantaceae bacterium]
MSTPPLFFLDAIPLVDIVLLTGDEGRHAGQVLRVRPGDRLWLSDGRGARLECTVKDTRSDGVVLAVNRRTQLPVPRPQLTVVQALPKGDRGELAVAVMTELGVDAIVPWAASRCVTQWVGPRGEKALDRWRRTAREAAKQSRRARVPVFAPLMSTRDVVSSLAGPSMLVLHESADEPLATCELPDTDEFVLVVGPEGGVADDELAALTEAAARPVRLGTPVMRTSTAGAAALAALSVRLGRWA